MPLKHIHLLVDWGKCSGEELKNRNFPTKLIQAKDPRFFLSELLQVGILNLRNQNSKKIKVFPIH